jgi:hypothetical protein
VTVCEAADDGGADDGGAEAGAEFAATVALLLPVLLAVWPPFAATLIAMITTIRPPTTARMFRAVCRLRRGGWGGPGAYCGWPGKGGCWP